MLLLKLTSWPGIALAGWLIGKLEDGAEGGPVTLSETVTLYEVLGKDGNIVHNFVTDHITTEGKMHVPVKDYSLWRHVEKGHEVLAGYERSLMEYRARKSGIVSPAAKNNGPRQAVGPQGVN